MWHLDEVRIVIGGRPHPLWRAVARHGYVLDAILQFRRNTRAGRPLLTRLLRRQGAARSGVVTDRLRSSASATRPLRLRVRHLSHERLNNLAENSHLPLRERIMQRFRSPGGCPRFVSVFSAPRDLFVPPITKRTALVRRIHRVRAFAPWNAATALGA